MNNILNDVSVVIPTYNRSAEIKETLARIVPNNIKEILIIDQSTIIEEADKIKEICLSFKKSKCPPKYFHFNFASTAMARNKGVSLVNKNTKIISFIDDDVTIPNNYFNVIIDKFNNNSEIFGVSAYQSTPLSKKLYIFDLLVRGLFFLRNYDKDKCRMSSPYGNTYPANLKKDIYTEWFPGFNTAYKKEIFNKYKFNDALGGYSLAEDTDFSYNLFLKNPKALLLTPDAIVEHRYSMIERVDLKKLSYINQIDHFYMYWKYKHSFNRFTFYWSILGIFFFRTLLLLTFKSEAKIKWLYFIKSLKYCIKNKDKIMNGKMRDFVI